MPQFINLIRCFFNHSQGLSSSSKPSKSSSRRPPPPRIPEVPKSQGRPPRPSDTTKLDLTDGELSALSQFNLLQQSEKQKQSSSTTNRRRPEPSKSSSSRRLVNC